MENPLAFKFRGKQKAIPPIKTGAGRIPTLGYNFPINIGRDLNDLRVDPIANDLLDNQFECDIAIMLTDHTYFPVFGIAPIGPNPDRPFAIAEMPSLMNPRWTFAHELGHLFGTLHDRGANGPGGDISPCSYGWLFTDAGGAMQQTILARSGAINPGDPGTRILHYSNPDVLFNGSPTGSPVDDNARTIRNTACQVAGFNPNIPVCIPILYANGPICIEDGDFEVISVINEAAPALPGHAPFSNYSWTVSSNASLIPNGANAYVSFSCISGCTVTVSLSVTSADGIVCTNLVEVEIVDEPCFDGEQGADREGIIGQKFVDKIRIYPNPVADILIIEIPDNHQSYQVALFDRNGILFLQEKVYTNGKKQLDLGRLSSGVYLLQLKNGEEVINRKIVIAKD